MTRQVGSYDGRGFEIGPTFALPLPAGTASDEVIGIDAGLSFTAKPSLRYGIGASIAYHYWPASAEFKDTFSEHLRDRTLNTLELGGGSWGLQVLELGVHFRFATATTRSLRPWLQFAGSIYRVNPNVSGYSGDAGFFTVSAPPPKHTDNPGASVSVGLDLLGGPAARFGIDATYHYVSCKDSYGDNLQVFTVGGHALFGR